jgi:ribosomal protein L21E
MTEYRPGDRVEVDVSAGIVPGAHPEPDWQPGTVVEPRPEGMYRVRLDAPIAGRTAEKDALPEHIRPLAGA